MKNTSMIAAALAACCCARATPPAPAPSAASALPVAPWVKLELGAAAPADAPVGLVAAHDGSKRLFVIEQRGRVRVLKDGKLSPTPFFDVAHLLGAAGGEQGLLGLAFHPRFRDNGRLFIAYTDKGHDNAVAELRAAPDRERVDPSSLRVLFAIDDFAGNHNGGHLLFGPDGKLWIGTGDGGGGGDPQRTGQDERSLLGKMLRVDVDALPLPPLRVTLEVWGKGLRNPWRYSFDRQTGDLWIADVGQHKWEEVNLVERPLERRGVNFGWSVMEGAHCFRPEQGCSVAGLELPVFEYRNGVDGCSITGGLVYRGKQHPALFGSYLVGDYCSGKVWTIRREQGRLVWALAGELKAQISSFGEDEDGELWVADHGAGVRRVLAAPAR